jgi:hypothetical protein
VPGATPITRAAESFDAEGVVLPLGHDPVKAECATRFRVAWQQVEHDADYARMKAEHREKYGWKGEEPVDAGETSTASLLIAELNPAAPS